MFVRDVDYCPAAFAVARATLEAVGGFSRAYRTFEIAGLELAVRLYAEHKRIRYLPAAVVTDYSGIDDPASHDYAHSDGWMGDWMTFVERNGMAPHLREQQEESYPRRHDRGRTKRALFIDADTPTPDQNAGSIFALNLMRMLGDLGFRVTFVPESNFAHRGKYTDDLQRHGVHTIYHPFYSSVREVLERIGHECDIIVGCRAYIAEKYFDMFRELAPNARVVFNTIDLHALRMTREAELSKEPALLQAAEAQWVSELASIAKADATIVVSTYAGRRSWRKNFLRPKSTWCHWCTKCQITWTCPTSPSGATSCSSARINIRRTTTQRSISSGKYGPAFTDACLEHGSWWLAAV